MRRSNSLGSDFTRQGFEYVERLRGCFNTANLEAVEALAEALYSAWTEKRSVYICGNGGSAANAIHIANDLHYGVGACGEGRIIQGIRVEALPANTAIVTCLANDTGYDNIYSHQLDVKGKEGDVLLVLSGSGNSSNVVRAIEKANEIGLDTFAIVAFSGGRCKDIANTVIHFEIDDMQIAEDTQLVVGHMCMQWLSSRKPGEVPRLK